MPVSAQAAFAVCAGLLFLIGVLDAVGVIPLVLRMLSVGADAEPEERTTRRERGAASGPSTSSRALFRASRSAGSTDSTRVGGVGLSSSGGRWAGGALPRRDPSRAPSVAGELRRSVSKGSRYRAVPPDDGRHGGGPTMYKPRRSSKLREVVEHADGDRPLAYAGSGASRGSYSSGVSRDTSGYSLSDSASSWDGHHPHSTDGEPFCGDGSSVSGYEKDELLDSDFSSDSELEVNGGGGGGARGGVRGGGGLRRSASIASSARRAYGGADEDGGRWASGSDVEAGGGRAAKAPPRRATFSTPAAEQILRPRSVLPVLARAEKAVMVVTWERLLGAFLCFCSLLSLLGSYVAMNGLPELLSPGRRLTAPVAAPTVLQEEQT